MWGGDKNKAKLGFFSLFPLNIIVYNVKFRGFSCIHQKRKDMVYIWMNFNYLC
jgi:hypothetical protein